MIKVGVLGAKGRMGSQVCQTVREAADLDLAA
jgi:dihydrodipicolinate reductase